MPKSKQCKEKTVNGVKFVEGSDNVFRDLGFAEDEAVNLLARSELMITIERLVKKSGWTQEEAAKALGTTQPRVSDLINGRIEKFTVDMLMKWLNRLGKKVELKVTDKEVA